MQDKKITLSNKEGVYALLMACKYFGVENVIICPGSRNAPLTISFSRSGLFKCHSIVDERVAGFYALGMALASKKPVAVICTSGSAAANISPALAEAFYLKVPVIAITADRPLAWTDQGNGQTIRQEGLFKNFTVDAFTLNSEPVTRDEIWLNRRKLSSCFAEALQRNPGPVHINVPFAEPLYGVKTYPVDFSGFYTSTLSKPHLSEGEREKFTKNFDTSKKVMILVGQLNPDPSLAAILDKYSALSKVIILTETTANVDLSDAVTTIDRLVMSINDEALLKDLMPDLLITCGGYIVSKKIKALLREFQPQNHWHINPFDSGLDTFQSLTDEIVLDPELFLTDLYPTLKDQKSTYKNQWQDLFYHASGAHDSYMEELPYSDFYAFREILKSNVPANIHMANSSPVRYIQLFGFQSGKQYFGNRGTSGIDGCTSTAAGFSLMDSEKQNLLITGDTAFMYDSNGLWNRDFPQNLKIIVINNGGGGIFRIIEGPNSTDELENYFEAHHPADIESIAKAHHLPFFKAGNKEELKENLPAFLTQPHAAILEIETLGDKNAPVLHKYFRHIREEIGHYLEKSADSEKN